MCPSLEIFHAPRDIVARTRAMVQLAIIPDCFRNDNETMEMFLKEQSKGKKIFMARQIATDPIFISYDVLWYNIIFMAKLFLYCDYFRYDITKL